jgi:hypothetical protein
MIKFDTGIRLSFREFDPLPDPSGLVLPVGTFSSEIKKGKINLWSFILITIMNIFLRLMPDHQD